MPTSGSIIASEPDGALKPLRRLGTLLQCPQRVEFCQEGNPAEQIFLLEEGLVTLSVVDANGRQYCPSYRTSGWILGSACALAGQPYPTACIAQTACKVRVIPTREFLNMLREDLTLSRYVLQMHAREICEQLSGLSGLALLTVRQRVEEFLWELVPNLPATKGKVQLPFSDVELTRFVSTTPQYLSSVFKQLADDGLLKRSDGWLTLTDHSRLWHREHLRWSR